MTRKQQLMTFSALAAMSVAGVAQAQDEPRSVLIQELVVTAEKREQSLQDVPVAISAYTGEQRELVGIQTVQDITNFTPGLSYTSGNDRLTLRGVGRLTNNLAAESAVANYSDGIFTTSTVEAGKTPLLVDRVEVLRGPQGTLYGRNAIGGAINTISRRPTEDFYGEVRANIGNYGMQLYEAAVSGPITEGLRFRFAGNYLKQDEGYYENLYNGDTEGAKSNQYYIEAQIEADLGERAEFWGKIAQGFWNPTSAGPGARSGALIGPYEYNIVGTSALLLSSGFAYSGSPQVSGVVGSPRALNPANADPRQFDSNTVDTVQLDENFILAGHYTYHFDNFDVKYLGGYQNYRYHLLRDFDNMAVESFNLTSTGIPGAVPSTTVTIYPSVVLDYEEEHHWWTNEINLTSTYDGPLQWIVGAYYFREFVNQCGACLRGDPRQQQLISGLVQAGAPAGTVAPRNPGAWINFTQQRLTNQTYAAFAQIDWEFSETWKTTLGIRYTKDEKTGTEYFRRVCYGPAACGAPVANLGAFAPGIDLTLLNGNVPTPGAGPRRFDPATGIAERDLDYDWDAWTGTAGLEWTPNDDTLIYGKYARGYKAGGFNSGTLETGLVTEKETVDSFEVGTKLNIGGQLQINAAAFYYKYKDAQVPNAVNVGGVNTTLFFNIADSVSQGVEVESIWSPTANLRFLLNYAYNDAHIEDAGAPLVDADDPTAIAPGAQPVAGAGGAQRLDGNQLPQAPKNKVAFNTTYTFFLDSGDLTLSGSYLWRDEQYGSIFTREYNRAPAWDQVDLRATYVDAEDRFTIIGYVKNVFDELGYDGGADGLPRLDSVPGPGVGMAYGQTFSFTPPRTYGVEFQYRF